MQEKLKETGSFLSFKGQNKRSLNFSSFFLFSVSFIYLFGVLHRFKHCTGHITMGSWKGRGNQYI